MNVNKNLHCEKGLSLELFTQCKYLRARHLKDSGLKVTSMQFFYQLGYGAEAVWSRSL